MNCITCGKKIAAGYALCGDCGKHLGDGLTHALRHGMPIEMVSMMLGHAEISTTQIYLDINEDDLRA